MSQVLMKAACFVLIIAMGYGMKQIHVFHQEDLKVFSTMMIKLTLPAAIVHNFSQITMDASMLTIVLIGLCCSGLYMGVGYFLFRRGSVLDRAFGLVNVSGYNIGCFTMPFVQNFLGPMGIAVTSLFDTGNSIICTGTSFAIASSMVGNGGKGGRVLPIVKKLFSSVPFDCYLIMTCLTLFHIKLPALALQFAETVGGANTFVALTMIGLGLELRMDRSHIAAVGRAVGTRLLVSLGLSLLFYCFSPFSEEVRRTLAILMFGPVSALGVAYTSMLGGDVNLASAINSVSILCGIVCLTGAILVF